MEQAQRKHYTVEEYMALEEQCDVRHEFFEGEVFAIAGADVSHNLIGGNFYVNFRQALCGRPCKV